jgi:hypothetical protein
VPANNPLLETLTVKGLRKRRALPDIQLDWLIHYFKQCKEQFERKYGEERFTSCGQSYYYVDARLLP